MVDIATDSLPITPATVALYKSNFYADHSLVFTKTNVFSLIKQICF